LWLASATLWTSAVAEFGWAVPPHRGLEPYFVCGRGLDQRSCRREENQIVMVTKGTIYLGLDEFGLTKLLAYTEAGTYVVIQQIQLFFLHIPYMP
jgi:hypothetical protein